MALEIPEQEEEDLLSRLVTVAEDLEPYVLQWPGLLKTRQTVLPRL